MIIAITVGCIFGVFLVCNGITKMAFSGKIIGKDKDYLIVRSKRSEIRIIECDRTYYYNIGDKVWFNYKDQLL